MATTTAFSDYSESNILKHFFRNTAMPAPGSSVYIALFTVMPGEAGTGGTEVSGGAYARVTVSTGTSGTGVGSGFAAPAAGACASAADILFPVATVSWGTILGIGIYDALTAGNLLFYGVADASVAIDVNDQYKIPSGSLTVTLD
jgi:hypothetical protein